MKRILATAAGFSVALGTFAGGALVTFMVLQPKPERILAAGDDMAALWTSQPVAVDTASQDLERIDGIAPPAETSVAAINASVDEASIDTTTTAAIGGMQAEDGGMRVEDQVQPEPLDEMQTELIVAHIDWCQDRYRSYDIDTNSYRPYQGGERECISPYLEELEAISTGGAIETVAGVGEVSGQAEFAVVEDRPAYVEAGFDNGMTMLRVDHQMDEGPVDGISAAHVRDCFSRYRSYRPQDNSYQPFGGGPRRQCD